MKDHDPAQTIIPTDLIFLVESLSNDPGQVCNDQNYPSPATNHARQLSAGFALTLAHEIRNPLTTINLSVEKLNRSISDDGLKTYLNIILQCSARINHQISELLRYEKLLEVNSEPCSLHQLLEEVLTLSADRILLDRIVVRKEYLSGDGRIRVDIGKIKIALTNIIINAIEAMSDQNGELILVVNDVGGKNILQIADNGDGISEEHLKDIFKPFFTNKPGGMGLGLSGSLEILQSNNVFVHVSSREGTGTCFTLFFDKAA